MALGKSKREFGDGLQTSPQKNQPTHRYRFFAIIALFGLIFAVIAGRLIAIGLGGSLENTHTASVKNTLGHHRPAIVDRNGRLLASDVKMRSLVADPKLIFDVDEAIERLSTVLPSLDRAQVRNNLSVKNSRFAWIKRGLTPDEASRIHNLGLPGFRFVEEPRRFYPAGSTASHILGYVDVDNRGRVGIEKYIDKVQGIYFQKLAEADEKPPLRLSMDLGAQFVMRDTIRRAMTSHRAKAGAGILLDIHNGEVVAMVSLPDYDPNHRIEALHKDRYNRLTAGTFELGSIFKAFTAAMALEIGGVSDADRFDATEPLEIGRFTIRDYHAQNRFLTLAEIFTHSSNIGSARLVEKIGPEKHRDFLGRMGLLNPMKTEMGPVRHPEAPKSWRDLRSMTISYGHGISVAPLQFAAAAATLFNGGDQVPITFLKRRTLDEQGLKQKILSPKTSKALRKLMRQNVLIGSGKKARAWGFQVGGKTGTAEKPSAGGYDPDKLLNSFLAIFPSNNPKFLLLVLLDEPQPDPARPAQRPTAGTTAAPLAREIISRVGPLIGVLPKQSSKHVN